MIRWVDLSIEKSCVKGEQMSDDAGLWGILWEAVCGEDGGVVVFMGFA